MKKRNIAYYIVLGIMLQIFAAFPAPVLAAYSYSYEGENFADTNWKVSGQSNITESQVSGGKHLSLYTSDVPAEEYYAEYSVSVLMSGVYDLELASSPVYKGSWASRIYVSVNGGSEVLLDGKYNEFVYDKISWYSCDGLNLNSGKNTIRFIVKDKLSSGYYSAFLDCFKLTRSTSKVRHIITDKDFNVFEDDEAVSFTIKTNNLVTNDTGVSWSVKSYYGDTVKSGSSTILKGTNSVDISLTDLPLGYYEISASDVKTGISIVKALENRNSYSDSPFAMDINFSGSIYHRYGRFAESYGKVVALSGVQWIRDRVNYSDLVSGEDGNYSITGSSIDREAAVLKPYGIKNTMVFDYMPNLIGEYSTYIPDDLIGTYELWKQIAKKFDGKVDMWEVLNETDLGGTTRSNDAPDMYAAFMKAVALGINDAECATNTTTSTQGACEKVDSDEGYVRMLMKNDIFDFSSIDNTHEHKQIADNTEKYHKFAGTENVPNHITQQEEQGKIAPIWVTEAGINIKVPQNTDFTLSEQRLQAKYLVTSAVESVASGTDKHFFFLGATHREGDVAWGMMNEDMTYPYMYAAFSAQSAMTNILGEGKYIGKISQLPQGVSGYTFENSGKSIAVLWSESGNKSVSLSVMPEKAYDMFGNEVAVNTTYEISENPYYLQFAGTSLPYESTRREMLSLEKKTFTDTQKVILTQKFSETARGGARASGYFINEGDNTVTVEVTNLSDKRLSGKIVGEFENGWSLSQSSAEIVIEPKAVKTVTFTITPRFDIAEDYLSFRGEFDGQKTSRSATRLKTRNDNRIIVEAEKEFNRNNAVVYENGISLNSDKDGIYKTSVNVNIPKAGFYNIRVLAGNGYKLYAGDRLIGDGLATDSEYTIDGVYVGWSEIYNAYLDKGDNLLEFVADVKADGASKLDKIVIDVSSNLWIEAEAYSKRSGYYAENKNSNAANNKQMRLFTYGMEFPTSENRLSYDFYTENSGSYDIWMLSSAPNVSWHTKWKWGLDSEAEAYPAPQTTVAAYDQDTTVPVYWYLVEGNVSLKKGIHSINILGDTEREEGDYALHDFDAIVVAESGKWSPSGNVDYDKVNFVSQYLLSEYDLTDIKENIYFPEAVNGDVRIKWTSSNEEIVSDDGAVRRPVYGTGGAAVTLTAQISCGDYSIEKVYEVTVADAEKLSEFNIGFTDDAGEMLSELMEKTNITTDIINYTGESLKLDVWCAVYNSISGQLMHVDKNSIDVAEGIDKHSFSVNVSPEELPISRLEVFMWDKNMKPYTAVSAIEGEWKSLNIPVKLNSKVYITGKSKTSGEQVSVMIMKNSDTEYAEMTVEQLLSNIVYVTELTTDETGKYMFTLNASKLQDCTVVVGSNSMPVQKVIYN